MNDPTSGKSSCILRIESVTSIDPCMTVGANVVTIPTAHAVDRLCFLLEEFVTLNATTATALPTVQFIQADGTKTEPEKREFQDSVAIELIMRMRFRVNRNRSSSNDMMAGVADNAFLYNTSRPRNDNIIFLGVIDHLIPMLARRKSVSFPRIYYCKIQ